MARRGQRSRYANNDDDDEEDEDNGWQQTSRSERRVNGDYSSALNSTSMTRELDDLMRTIEADWNVVMTANVCFVSILWICWTSILQYSAVETAMQLMDRSSLGRDYNAFKALYSRIERALQFVVNGTRNLGTLTVIHILNLLWRPLSRFQQLDRHLSWFRLEPYRFSRAAQKITRHP